MLGTVAVGYVQARNFFAKPLYLSHVEPWMTIYCGVNGCPVREGDKGASAAAGEGSKGRSGHTSTPVRCCCQWSHPIINNRDVFQQEKSGKSGQGNTRKPSTFLFSSFAKKNLLTATITSTISIITSHATHPLSPRYGREDAKDLNL